MSTKKKKIILISVIAVIVGALIITVVLLKREADRQKELDEWLRIPEFKTGKYLLQREWGLDESDYIELFDDNTVQFTGKYWEEKDAEEMLVEEEYRDELWVLRTERQHYIVMPEARFVAFAQEGESKIDRAAIGFRYIDESTFELTRKREAEDDVIDFDENIYGLEKDESIVSARYIYVG